jgi:hypothetical protein
MGLDVVVPAHAEVISAVGDALSLIRVEREQVLDADDHVGREALVEAVEAEALAAGAASDSLDVRVSRLRDRGAVRVTVTGAVGLKSGAVPGRPLETADGIVEIVADRGFADARPIGSYWLATHPDHHRFLVLDRFGDIALDLTGELIEGDGDITGAVSRLTRQVGPVTIAPEGWLVGGARIIHLEGDQLAALAARQPGAIGSGSILVIGRD